ncbi:MAG: hypothetical protein JNL93_01750 [Pelomonas sp.]|nr:hypothetical protein [Roseateles sp.]
MTTPHHLAARNVLIPFAIALLLLARPYEGIDRDDALYLGQVLQSASQPQLGADLFFASGSQNDYALYARLLAPLYEAFGIAATHMGLLGLSWLATLATLLHLQRRLGVEDAHLRLLGLVCLVAASPFYGGLRKFGVLEPFLTARTLAEPLVVGSLALLSMRRLGAAVALQLAAALLHPLMALPALLMTWLLAVARNRRWLALAAAPIVLLVLAALGMAPERLIQRYDTAWWDLVATRNAQVVLGHWTLPDWLTVATDALLVALAALAPQLAGGRRVLLALLAASGLLLTVNLLGTDLWQAVFITQLQPWRSLGLLHLAAWVLTPFVLWHTWQRGPMGRLCAAALALAQVSSHAGSSYGLPILFVWALCQVAAVRGLMATPAMYRLALGASALGALALSCADVLARLERLHWHPTVSLALDEASRIATEPLIALTLAGLVLWGAARHAAARRLGWGLGLALLVFAAAHWDRRDALARAVEQPPEPRPFQDVVPPDASVYWPEHLAAVWGLLQRASHFDEQQGAGLLFNRATAEGFRARRALYGPIIEARDQCRMGVALSRGSASQLAACDQPSPGALAVLCQGTDRPDFLVFAQPLSPPPLRTWTVGTAHYHLYACTQFQPPATR